MRVAIYIRVSTRLQEEKYSLDAQHTELTRYVAKEKWEVVGIFKDVDKGGKFEKPGLQALLDVVDDKLVDIVLCVDQDRLSRLDTIEWELLKQALRENNVKIAEPGRMVDLDNEDDEFFSDIKNLFAKREKKLIVRRMTRGLKQFTREGKLFGRQPDEYYVKDGKVHVNHSRAWVIAEIDKMYLEENIGFSRIAARLNAIAPTASGRRWSEVIVYAKLKNPAYHGVLRKQFKDETIEVEGVYPPLRTKETYERIQRKLKRNGGKRPALPHFLRDIAIKCQHCGFVVSIAAAEASSSERRHNYYLKHGSVGHVEPCKYERLYINTERFREKIENELKAILFSEETAERYIQSKLSQNELMQLELDLQQKREALRYANERLDKVIDLYIDGLIEKEALDRRKENIQKDLSRIMREVEKIEMKLANAKEKRLTYQDVVSVLLYASDIEMWEETQKQSFLGSIFPSATFNFESANLTLHALVNDVLFDVPIVGYTTEEVIDKQVQERAIVRHKETQVLVDENPGINFKRLCALSPYNAVTLRNDAARFGWWKGLALKKGSPELLEQRLNAVRELLKENPRMTAKEVAKRSGIYENLAQKLVKQVRNEMV